MSLQENAPDVNGVTHDLSTSSEMGHNGGPPLDDGVFPSREGFVAIARALRDHWLVGFGQNIPPADTERGSYSRAEAWIDLIMECRYREGAVNNNGKKMVLRKGQLLGAVSWLANRWNWSPKTVRTFLDKLEKEGMITQTAESPDQSAPRTETGRSKGRYANVLTVCKYDLFQLAYRDARQVPGMVKGKLPAGTGQDKGDIYKEETKEQRNKGTIVEAAVADCDDGMRLEDGKLIVSKKDYEFWLDRFDGDAKRLELALIDAKAAIQTRSSHPVAAQVSRRLAQIVAEKLDRDARYQHAAKVNKQAEQSQKPKTAKPWMIRHG